ncbi:MAG: ATP-binding protein [candidate division KSB1 bacterium]|nr:ATP-binding protein [candidate division KSB1 bacterium]
MHFVGRKKELDFIGRCLEEGQNILIQGKFGMGRTALVRRAAELYCSRYAFWFADFGLAPEKMCRRLYKQIINGVNEVSLPYKSIRRLLVRAAADSPNKVVLILDNINSLSLAKNELCRYFALSNAFLFIGIVESSLDPDSLLRLRATLRLSRKLCLDRLSATEAESFFRFYAEKRQLGWSELQIADCCRRTRGYPLRMAMEIKRVAGSALKNRTFSR